MASTSPWVNRLPPAYAPSDSEAVPYFGPDPCWDRGCEGQDPETCSKCRGVSVRGRIADPLQSGLSPQTGNVVAFVCEGCGRSLVRNPRGRLMPPNMDVLNQIGDLKHREAADRAREAVLKARPKVPVQLGLLTR